MKLRKIFTGFLIFSVFIFTGCRYASDNLFYDGNSVEQRENSITELTGTGVENLGGEYSFVVFSDVHIGNGKSSLPEAEFFAWLDSVKNTIEFPKFVLCLGDVADHGYADEMQDFKRFADKIESYGVKVFNTVGNHDVYNSGWQNWQSYAYPHTSFYKFKTAGYSWYGLDSGTGSLGKTQMKNLTDDIKRDNNPKIIFTHYPLYTKTLLFCMEDTTERNELISLFAQNNVKMYFAGHIHKYEENDFGSFIAETVPSFMYNRQWGLVTINENTGKYTFSLKG